MACGHSGREMGRHCKENRPWPIRKKQFRYLPGGENRKPFSGWATIEFEPALYRMHRMFCKISLPQGNGKPFCLWHASLPVGVLTRNWRSNKSKAHQNWKHSFYTMRRTIRAIPVALKIYMKFPNWKSCTINRMYPKLMLTSSSIAGYIYCFISVPVTYSTKLP
jgi:hypothetical protein